MSISAGYLGSKSDLKKKKKGSGVGGERQQQCDILDCNKKPVTSSGFLGVIGKCILSPRFLKYKLA